MVLCQELLYNTPCTYTIDNTNRTYVSSLPTVQGAIEAMGMSGIVAYYMYYMLDMEYVESWDMPTSNPTAYKIIKTILDNCTASVDGGEYISLDEAFESTSYDRLVCRFPRVGISREDLANAEIETIAYVLSGEEGRIEGRYSMIFLYMTLAVAGYLTPAETYADLELAYELIS